MKTFFTLALLTRLAVGGSLAQESPIVGPPACRFLFYVESSRDMARISSATAATVAHLVATGASGQMQPGDPFAVWHYNEEPFQDQFPIRIWTPEKSAALAGDVGAFLRKLPHDKPAQSGLALREMYFALAATDPLTVFLVNNGDTPLVGTPFDLAINKTYLERGAAVRARRLPFVTTLRCVNKKTVSWVVTAGKEELVLPDAPPVAMQARAITSTPPPPPPVPPPAPPAVAASAPALPAPLVAPTGSAPRILPRAPIRDVFALPFDRPLAPPPTHVVAPPEPPARAANPSGAASETAPAAAPSPPALPPVLLPPLAGTNAAAISSSLLPLRILPARTNALSVAAAALPDVAPLVPLPIPALPKVESPATNPSAVVAAPTLSAPTTFAPTPFAPTPAKAPSGTSNPPHVGLGGFARKTAPTFALDAPKARPAAGALPFAEGPDPAQIKPKTVDTAPPRGTAPPPRSAVVATNWIGKPLATVAPTIAPNPKVKPVQFLIAGLVTLLVAGWFIVLILRGARPRSRTSISRAIDE